MLTDTQQGPSFTTSTLSNDLTARALHQRPLPLFARHPINIIIISAFSFPILNSPDRRHRPLVPGQLLALSFPSCPFQFPPSPLSLFVYLPSDSHITHSAISGHSFRLYSIPLLIPPFKNSNVYSQLPHRPPSHSPPHLALFPPRPPQFSL